MGNDDSSEIDNDGSGYMNTYNNDNDNGLRWSVSNDGFMQVMNSYGLMMMMIIG